MTTRSGWRICGSGHCCLQTQDTIFSSLDAQQIPQALAMCGLAVFTSRRMQHSQLTTPEQQLTSFFTFMGLPPLPGRELLLAAGAPGAATAAGGVAAGHAPGSSKGTQRTQQITTGAILIHQSQHIQQT